MSLSFITAWEARVAAGEPVAVIRVHNLQSTLGPAAAHDAWGRPGRSQPILVSAEVALVRSFAEASASDRVAADTVHYGSLSKTILASLSQWAGERNPRTNSPVSGSLRAVLEGIWQDLTGLAIDGSEAHAGATAPGPPLLSTTYVRSLSVTVHLPKASLVGDGVSLTALCVYNGHNGLSMAETLQLHGLRVPTLIGVHPHERQAKQAVVANVAIDLVQWQEDSYWKLEATVVKILETSSFETLEALGTHVAKTILSDFPPQSHPDRDWQVRVTLEKPIAVPFADAPVVEVRMSASDLD